MYTYKYICPHEPGFIVVTFRNLWISHCGQDNLSSRHFHQHTQNFHNKIKAIVFHFSMLNHFSCRWHFSGADPGFQVRGGAHIKKLRRAEGGAKIFGVFRVKNHDFTQKNLIFSNCGGRRENCWGISCEKSHFTPKNLIFSNFRGGARRVRPPLDPPLYMTLDSKLC